MKPPNNVVSVTKTLSQKVCPKTKLVKITHIFEFKYTNFEFKCAGMLIELLTFGSDAS